MLLLHVRWQLSSISIGHNNFGTVECTSLHQVLVDCFSLGNLRQVIADVVTAHNSFGFSLLHYSGRELLVLRMIILVSDVVVIKSVEGKLVEDLLVILCCDVEFLMYIFVFKKFLFSSTQVLSWWRIPKRKLKLRESLITEVFSFLLNLRLPINLGPFSVVLLISYGVILTVDQYSIRLRRQSSILWRRLVPRQIWRVLPHAMIDFCKIKTGNLSGLGGLW